MPLLKPPPSTYFSYHIARGEQGVLTFELYKSYLLPLWRFRTVPISKSSSEALWEKFLEFYDVRDFVGMDMGMTRAKRYANHAGERKYSKTTSEELPKSAGKQEKVEASLVFKRVWESCREHEGSWELKAVFLKEQKAWMDENGKVKIKKGEDVKIKDEEVDRSQKTGE